MLIPYKVKNPVKHFPFATLSIILINVLVYAFTTHSFLVIREDITNNYAFALGRSQFYKFFTACFLHGDIFHIAGNMLFLWIFGGPVEDRLGFLKYVALYFITGAVGDFLQALIDKAVFGEVRPCIGASGCIMGVVGAYWYMYSWSTVCVFYWIGWFIHGVSEVKALWIILFFFAMDLFEGVIYSASAASGGVANFAHIGGSLAGALICVLLAIKRDTEEISQAKEIQYEVRDYSLLPLETMYTMLKEDPTDSKLIRALIGKAIGQKGHRYIVEAMRLAGASLIDADPSLVSYYLISLNGDPRIYPPAHLIRLANMIEKNGDYANALQLFRIIVNNFPNEPDTEIALYRMASICWQSMKDARGALSCLAEMARRFPNGKMMLEAHNLQRQINDKMGRT